MRLINRKKILILGAVLLGALLASRAKAEDLKPLSEEDIAQLPHVVQTMVPPPALPEHEQVDKDGFKVIQVRLEVVEKQRVIDDQGTKMWTFSYDGMMPGPMFVTHVGDYVELTLVNKAGNTFEHNIDVHASTGALGGGALTAVQPGEQVTLRFRTTLPGVFVYHCAPGGIMIPWHVTHGMNGAMLVLPRKGLTDGKGNPIRYDKAFYIGEQDFYLKKLPNGKYKQYASAAESMADDMKVMETDNPSHDVFNGRVGSLTGDNAMKANVGDTVLILHETANRDTRPHLIGGHGDYVWERGSFDDPPALNLQTWFIPGGCAGAAIYKFLQPGVYAYLNHDLIDAVMKGSTAHFKVEGKWNDDLMKQIKAPAPSPKE